MKLRAILAIDQGTSNTKALLVDMRGKALATASRPVAVEHPQPGWAQQSAKIIWQTVQAVVNDVVAAAGSCDIAAVAITNQRETVLLWDVETGEPIGPCVIWQCRRSADRCVALAATGSEDLIQQRTGLRLDPLFPAAKIGWLLDNVDGARDLAAEGKIRAGTIDAWLLWKLTAGEVHATDFSNASRTQLLAINEGTWDPELCELFGVPWSILPEVRASDSLFGRTAAGTTDLPAGTPIHAMIGDSHAALFGHAIEGPGEIKATCGTGSSLMMLTGERISSRSGLSETIAWNRGGVTAYALEGNITVSGHAAAFMVQLLGLSDEGALTQLASTVAESAGVVFVPGLAGLGAPHWDAHARGTIAGMSLGTKPAHLARATFEAIALQIHDVFRAMESDSGTRLPALLVDGGATKNDLLMKLLAGILDRPVMRRELAELSAFGAARMAAAALGTPLAPAEERILRFDPDIPPAQRERILAGWRNALVRAKSGTASA